MSPSQRHRTNSSSEPTADTKKAIVLALLRRNEGATTAEIAKTKGWQNHSIRGFISGTITKKMGLKVDSAKKPRVRAGQSIHPVTIGPGLEMTVSFTVS